MSAIERSSLPEQVFRQLVGAVLDGRYAPGERLPAQRALAADLGVNMASLREGIKRLEQLRLVDVRHGDAMRVQDWRAHGGLDVLAYAVPADPTLTRSLFEARRLLLTEAARLAAQRATEEQHRALGDLAAAFAAAPDDVAAQLVDLAYMATIIDAAGNLVFRLILNSIRELYLANAERFRPIVAGREELAPLYRRAARAIAAAEPGRAAAAMARLAGAQEERMLRAAAGDAAP
ncbi:MAG TPA: GntR family transcriptional regulator [Baekduia sp.]|uniref:FadR/GntR family transcriptional regulator n=1 Tax=Baekduia sp. TaxID=2600305 RepID=UPI002B9BF7E6|nr:GntR family transcriptional regulator [Baekduia sp.]HMJ37073.1 GntR family transcriptional regulator [Baekduia sp.]